MLIRTPSQQAFGGDGVYNTTGAGQSRTRVIERSGLARFYVRVENDGLVRSEFRVDGSRESSAFAVRYRLGSQNVSPQVKAGTLVLALEPGDGRTLTVEIEGRNAPPGSRRQVQVTARSTLDGDVRDRVLAEVRVPQFTAEQRRIAQLVNESRSAAGRRPLALHRTLRDKAQAWAQKMARDGRLSHSDLDQGVPPGWRSLGENVGYGVSISQVHRGFMSSGGHRANILGNYNHLGTGYATGHGRVWIVQVFMLR